MFFAFSNLVFVTLALAATASSSESLKLSLFLSGPSAVTTVRELQITTTLVNTGDVEVKLLNDPRTVLDTFETDSFIITDPTGKSPSFHGIAVKYVPATVVKNNLPESFTVLAPGASTQIAHDLFKAYNFTSSGEATYDIVANNQFSYVDANGELQTIHASQSRHTTAISGELAAARHSFDKRVSYQSCNSDQQSTIATAVTAAKSYASESQSYLKSHTSSTTRFVTWFGTYTSAHQSTVLTDFTKMVNADFSTFTFDCSCNAPGFYAYVYPDEFGIVYLCPVFWRTTTTGTDSRAGTIIHESSHFFRIASTQDYAYGQAGSKQLAINDSNRAIANADNHEYFAENTPVQS
ncbi:peptidyl-Lys metalloendopeptidase [Favolaschia claudopus]|uniref:Peptidyl-Lys metalloendopeptidase n=1 Tax=Favolaschia claudopus TaxID=2862362 RepID=A0AAW0BFP6_9AGAR